MKRWLIPCLLIAVAGLSSGCEEDLPTGLDEDLFPIEPQTLEIRLPWEVFAANLQVLGGFGSPLELPRAVAARKFRDTLDSRIVARWAPYPSEASVRDSTGTIRPDTSFTFIGGRIVARFDTAVSALTGPVDFSAHAIEQEWDPRTATWRIAVDTVNDRRLWPEPGAGPATLVGTGIWDPEAGDSLVIEVDSATVARWEDPTDDPRSVRLDLETEGLRLEAVDLDLRLDSRPSSNPDTVIVLNAAARALTFIYDPFPEPPPDGIRIGGAPAWRTVLEMGIPATLDGPEELCERVGCPFPLAADRINAASLVLRSRASQPAFQPSDTIRLDVRPVLAPARLPKSPLGPSFVGRPGRAVDPSAFGEEPGQEISIPVTAFVQDLVRGQTPQGLDPPESLALLSFFEPLSISFASFVGPGEEGEPFLRLIVTTPDTVEIR